MAENNLATLDMAAVELGYLGRAKAPVQKTYYKILDASGLAFSNLTGIKSGGVLELLWDAPDRGQVILRRKEGCTVSMDYSHVEKLEGGLA